jgi:effector-binding domain-containing protein
MVSHQTNPTIPLSDQDTEALDEIFAKVEVEEIKDIEARVAGYSAIPLEPWEEKGWVINSSLPIVTVKQENWEAGELGGRRTGG